MNLEEQLAQYRQRYSMKAALADEKQESPWDGEIESLKESEEQDVHDVWASEVGSDMNTSFSPSRQDYDTFVQGMMADGRVQKHQGAVEQALNELLQMVNDPSNPMDAQQAQQLFTQLMQQNVYPDFSDEPAPMKRGKK